MARSTGKHVLVKEKHLNIAALILGLVAVIALAVTVWALFFRETKTPVLAPDYAPQELEQNAEEFDAGGEEKLAASSGGGASVSFTTGGSLYYGAVHKQGVLDEETDVGPGAPDTTLDTPVGELADDLLADGEREYLDEGFDIHIKLTVDDITASVAPADVSAVASVTGDCTARVHRRGAAQAGGRQRVGTHPRDE